MPHVAPFFRGITLTVDVALSKSITEAAVRELYANTYASEPLVKLLDSTGGGCGDGIPLVRDNAGAHHVALGGFRLSSNQRRLVMVATLDNLLKGAATQAVQNVNLALGFDELTGIPDISQ